MTDEYTGIREALGGDRVAELEAACAAMRAAIAGFFRAGPGCAVPVKHEPDWGEPCNRTWNAKLDALQAALSSTAGADLLKEIERLRKEVGAKDRQLCCARQHQETADKVIEARRERDAARADLGGVRVQLEMLDRDLADTRFALRQARDERDALRAEVAALKGEHDALRAVCLDLHDSLGVRWGDDPYHRIGKLKESEAACGALRERIRLLEGALARVLEMAGSHTRPVPDEHPAGYGAIYRVARAALDTQTGEPGEGEHGR